MSKEADEQSAHHLMQPGAIVDSSFQIPVTG
jgi:hypothetical protein